MHGLNNHLVKEKKKETAPRLSFVSAMSAAPFLSGWREEPIWAPAGRALRQSGRRGGEEAGAEQSGAASHTYGSGRQAEH